MPLTDGGHLEVDGEIAAGCELSTNGFRISVGGHVFLGHQDYAEWCLDKGSALICDPLHLGY
jgi:hypothetical protein